MICLVSLRAFWQKAKIFCKMIVLAWIALYVLPKLFGLLWQEDQLEKKIREEHLLEKPLRVYHNVEHDIISTEKTCVT